MALLLLVREKRKASVNVFGKLLLSRREGHNLLLLLIIGGVSANL